MAVISKHAEELLHDSILTEIVQRSANAFHPENIYLFGSVARGEAGPHSDYDLLMVLRDSSLPRYRRDQEAFRVLTGVGASKDILVLTKKEFESQRKAPSSLPATVEREGILLYAAEDNAMAKTEVFIAENLKWAPPQPVMKLMCLLSS